ncbi:hypothetical protein P376_5547 [Streptomyces sp. HCCB10043]|uniref:Predicted protein n=1 Tax=Streptomyces filamentosus NRRL 15998 TaxID=457431 RepID=D6ACC3_STRFL|nr:predicted protein [Streptomyces filamentosus NRRL 15998]ESU46473.1 hypothetical protein P376_5547 [Streptomyces sp. HCCB10043]EWS91646.1 hypothetical protein SSIG_02092 [Streptomyces filamentosus NRRL 11379]
MTGPSRLPHGWHAREPRAQAVTTGEAVIEDDAPDPEPLPNRAARRAAARALRKEKQR